VTSLGVKPPVRETDHLASSSAKDELIEV